MPRLPDLIPDAEILVTLEPAELAPYVLDVARSERNNGLVLLQRMFFGVFEGDPYARDNKYVYPRRLSSQIELVVAEAWSWLQANQLLVPDAEQGYNGYMRLSRRAETFTSPNDFKNFVEAATFPKKLLHPLIAEDVWLHLARGEYDIAVFIAFRAVEEQVRKAGGFAPTDLGTDLMRRAFNPNNGPLSQPSDPIPEREALANLFAGAIGSYKNPHSHRTVAIEDARDAQEMVVLASHLLSIVEARNNTVG